MSVIIPARNASKSLPSLLSALAGQTASRELFEVLVVDDASTDDTAEVIRSSGIARLVSAPRHGGSYVARNLGIVAAYADVLAFTDVDCLPSPTWIEDGLEALHRSDAGLVAGHVEVPLGRKPSAAALVGFARHHLDQDYHVSVQGFGATANLWMRKDVITRVGMFNERLNSGGDAEFCHRAVARGVKLCYSADVVVTHPPRSRARELARKQLRLGFGAAQQIRHAEGPLSQTARIWLHPGAYVPRFELRGLDRLHAQGLCPTVKERAAMRLVQYFCYQLPIAVGNLAGAISESRLRRSAGVARSS